jgi:hypothetical protein
VNENAKEADMSATAELRPRIERRVERSPGATLGARIRTRLHRRRIDLELTAGVDPNANPLRQARALELVGEASRRRLAAGLERLLAAADAGPAPFTSKVPVARAAIRDSRWDVETILERLLTSAYISPQGVAMIGLLLGDGAGPLYGDPTTHSTELRRALETVVHAIDHGPALVV